MTLAAGTRLGPYEILAPLGAGGMGEVYRAHDSRLGRDVAIKVLPQHLSEHPEVRARFEREARTVSSLNHPQICALFDVGREDGTDFLVMELVEGETLAARIARGPLPVAETLRIGAQIADALDRAHRAGVVHRDLKPGNVMLTRSGAKLMDFGLARVTGLSGSGSGSGVSQAALTTSPTVAAPLTAEGTIVGTFQYMAPEQLEGKDLDARSDLWALGCVLYEMATGRRAFEGRSQASLISSIMSGEPASLSSLAPLAPPGLERVVRQALAKDPDDRWQSAGDLRRELEHIAGSFARDETARSQPATHVRMPSPWLLIAIAALAITGVAVAFGPWRSRPPGPRLVRFTLAPPRGMALNRPAEPTLSPDGERLAFVVRDSSGQRHIAVRSFTTLETRVLPGTETQLANTSELPFWSPDGRMLGYFADGKLRKVGLDGSAPVPLCDAPDGRGGSWSRDGVILFAPNSQGPIYRVSQNGGPVVAVTNVDAPRERGHRYPQFLPDSKHFLYVGVENADLLPTYIAHLDGGKPVELCRAGSEARYIEGGYLVYLDQGVQAPVRRLLAQRFDPRTRHRSGEAAVVLDDVNADNFGFVNVATSGGELVAQHWANAHAKLEWLDRRGITVNTAAESMAGYYFSLSADGSRVAYVHTDPTDLYQFDIASGRSTRVTFDQHLIRAISWSADGRRLVFASLDPVRGWEARVATADGTGTDSVLFHGPGLFTFPAGWSSDGRWVVAQCSDSLGNYDLWRIPMAGLGRPELYEHTAAEERDESLSPDGHWLAIVATEAGHTSLYVQSFPNPGPKVELSIADPVNCQWSSHGDALIALDRQRRLFMVQLTIGDGVREGATTPLFTLAPGATFVGAQAGEQRFLISTPIDLETTSSLEVVLGWQRLLAK